MTMCIDCLYQGSVQMSINLTDLFEQINASDETSEFSPVLEMTEFSVAQSIDIPLTTEDTATVTALASTHNGRGTGSLMTSFRRVLADLSWFRVRQFCDQIVPRGIPTDNLSLGWSELWSTESRRFPLLSSIDSETVGRHVAFRRGSVGVNMILSSV